MIDRLRAVERSLLAVARPHEEDGVSPTLLGAGSISRLCVIRVEALDQGFDPSETLIDLSESTLD